MSSTAPEPCTVVARRTVESLNTVADEYRTMLAGLDRFNTISASRVAEERGWSWRYLADSMATGISMIADVARDTTEVPAALLRVSDGYRAARDMVTALSAAWTAGRPLPETAEQAREIRSAFSVGTWSAGTFAGEVVQP